MPSAGMRRTTRVFGARVLRSGRKVWTLSEGKQLKKAAAHNEVRLIDFLDDSEVGGGGHAPPLSPLCTNNGWHGSDAFKKQEASEMDVDLKLDSRAVELESDSHTRDTVNSNSNVNRRWGIVYRRKRSRAQEKNLLEAFDGSSEALEERRFGKYFVRQRWKKKAKYSQEDSPADSVFIYSSHYSGHLMCCLLHSLLGGMSRASVTLTQFFAFISSRPICDVFSLHGIHFLKEYTPEMKAGVCTISAVRCSVPLFTVNFSAIPFCFMYLHSTLSLKYWFPSGSLSVNSVTIYEECKMSDNSEDDNNLCNPVIASVKYKDDSRKQIVAQPIVRLPKLPTRGSLLRSGRTIQKRRRALRSRRGKRSSPNKLAKPNGALVSDGLRFRHNNGFRLSSAKNIKGLKSAVLESTKDLDSTSCSANLLVIESDRCYREEGAIIALELSSVSRQWTLTVKRDGTRRYSLTAEKVMRPCSSNRITHDIIWTVDNSWKLEFPNRRDWWIFKELYKECADRNAHPSAVSTIPIPEICEVSGYGECWPTKLFSRPVSYITEKRDELARAMDRRSANYDMDSDDEEWLNDFNSDKHDQCISVEKFELMIDSLEKWGFHNQDDCSDEKTALSACLESEGKDVAEAVYSYWIKKRKKKRSPLIKIFQMYQPRKSVLPTRPVVRKKRSFKRQGSHAGRGKQHTFFQALGAQRNAEQQQSAIVKAKEAKSAANRQEGVAVAKRHKAQQLMENADLATYKAVMALKIADAVRIAESAGL
ncbi:hypothetical protein DM860_009393 [Cuscuta australis]|uniref:Enhancer of polycomb-like protein n=1 Tax=Cuscuta australis TaxID=267555 RepID=A0A328DBW4_9ASTE|nr:hypothetical protein DM860_009393 [Cuscuta australis]